jgi:hypothetical protein
VLFAFPSRYWFTIGQNRVFSLAGWSPRIQTGFHVPRLTQEPASSPDRFRLRACHALWIPFPEDSTNGWIGNSTVAGPTTPTEPEGSLGLGSSDFARHYFRNRGFFLFLQVLRWFTSLGSLVPAYGFSGPYMRFAHVGFPIRRSPDITPVCGSPELIAACHVLHRLILPRHPPCALSSLTIELTPRRS